MIYSFSIILPQLSCLFAARHQPQPKLNHKAHKGHKEVFLCALVAFVVKKTSWL